MDKEEVMPTGGEAPPKQQHRLHSRMGKMFPDRQWNGDDEYLDEADNHIEALEGYKKNSEESNRKIIDLLESEPELSAVLRDMLKGMTLREALARNVDIDSLVGMEGDPDWDNISKAKNERIAKLEENRKWQSQVEENQQKTIESLAAFTKNKGLDEATVNDFIGYVSAMLEKAFNTYLDEETLERLYQAYSYKKDVADAENLGMVKGRNEKIQAMRKEKTEGTDGLPKPTSSVAATEQEKAIETDSLLDAMDIEIARQKKMTRG